MKPIVVTTGTIGDHVARGLTACGMTVRTLKREDFASRLTLAQAFDGAETFFSVTPFVKNLVELGTNTIDAAREAGVRYIVRSSILGADAGAPSAMHRWHAEVEAALRDSGVPYTILRPNTFFQSTLQNAPSVAAQNAFYLPQGDGAVSMIDARDIAAVAILVLLEPDHGGKTYNLTGPEALNNDQVAQKLSTVLSREIHYVDVNDEQAAAGMSTAGMPPWQVDAMLDFMHFCKAGEASGVFSDAHDMLKRDVLTFDEFLRENTTPFTGANV